MVHIMDAIEPNEKNHELYKEEYNIFKKPEMENNHVKRRSLPRLTMVYYI